MTRAPVAAAVCAGAALVVAPFLAWFEADGPDGPVRISGVSATGALWALVVLGAVPVLAGVLHLAGRLRPSPAAGAVVAVAGSAALLAAVAVLLWPPVRLVADVDGGPRVLDADVAQLPATVVATAAASLAVLAGLVWWRAARPGGP